MIIDSEFYGLEKIQDPADDSFNAPAQGTLQLGQYVAQPRSQVPFLTDVWHLAHYPGTYRPPNGANFSVSL